MAAIWFFGKSGAGKTTIVNELLKRPEISLYKVIVLDADVVRKSLNKDLGFTLEDREENIRRIACVAKIVQDQGFTPIVTAITPKEHHRLLVKAVDPRIKLIHIKCSTDKCIERDPKGLYSKALAGEIKNFTGVSQDFDEPPSTYDWILNTEFRTPKECVNELLHLAINRAFRN